QGPLSGGPDRRPPHATAAAGRSSIYKSGGPFDPPPVPLRTRYFPTSAFGRYASSGDQAAIRNLDVDLERRHRVAAIHGDLHVVLSDLHVSGDHRHDFLAQYGDEIGLVTVLAFVG